jgi:hypothetical protein
MERPALERRLTPCAEFPNDNPDLHHGSIWDWVNLCDVPLSELPTTRARTHEVDEKPRDLEMISDAPVAELPAIPLPPAARFQVVSLLTILEGAPRDSGRRVRVIDEAVEELRVEPPPPAMGAKSIQEPGVEHGCPAEPAPIVSWLPNLGEDVATEAPVPAASADLLGDQACSGPVEGSPGEEFAADGGESVENDEPIEIVDELSFDDAVDGAPPQTERIEPVSEPPPADSFAQLVSALESVARALGASDTAIATLDALLGQTRLDGSMLDDRTIEALIAGDIVARGARGVARSQAFTGKVVAWQGILRGESEDFALPDGGALEPLDEWAADILARIVGPPARAEGVRRDLRKRGIAAFGLVADAA